ncbi:MAG: 4-hydroxy-3-methylbut-2-enyl diphosphate reductase [Armatimonadetes bacterium]|nr:4-hydroxy-3-methylbut-2-enyl diphosphate reductase [Armatimonadota bacterium]MBX3109997.1 4-hydroxy-3-methylbut-2-enyl diphosphate reductase [Fimbriimonadaceae bacterium]
MALDSITLAAPRGFCAGVAYAIEVVNLALKIHGAPLYVRHAIVHNEHVVKSFESQGVVFVEDVHEVPEGATVVFSAHGVSPQVRQDAASRGLNVIDATCPLVTKVHNEAKRFDSKGYLMVYVGHRGHVEAEGTMGEAPGRMILVETPEEAETVELPDHERLALVTQTTLSVDEVESITQVLERRFPHLERPKKEDICYATTNRQGAVKEMAKVCEFIIVVGSTQSSNSNRLAEVARGYGAESVLLMSPDELERPVIDSYRTIGVTSGASTPDELVEAVISRLLEWSPGTPVKVLETVKEDIEFIPSRNLVQLAQSR